MTVAPPAPTLRYGAKPVQICSPLSFWNAKLPALSSLDPLSVRVVADIAAQGVFVPNVQAYPNINTTTYSSKIIVVDNTTPRVKVRCKAATQPWAKAFGDLCLMGVPIPAGVQLPLATDTDAEMVFLDRDRDQLWEFWQFRPNSDPTSLAQGVKYECGWGGRMSHVSTNPGHWVDRWASWQHRTYPNLPTDPVKVADFEQKSFGATATSLPLSGGILTEEDVLTKQVRHAIGMSLVKNKVKAFVWPAQRGDGNDASKTVTEGMRLRFPANMAVPTNLHPIAQLYFVGIRDYGCVIWDKAGALGFRAEPAVNSLLGGTPKYKVLFNFPWNKLQLLPVGSDANPNP